jgi:hypothetical protein
MARQLDRSIRAKRKVAWREPAVRSSSPAGAGTEASCAFDGLKAQPVLTLRSELAFLFSGIDSP